MHCDVIPIAGVDSQELRHRVRQAVRTRNRTMGMIGVALRRAIIAGRLLIQGKGEREHGEFQAWLESEGIVGDEADQVSYRSAVRWMGLAKFDSMHPGALDSCNSITQAYKMAGLLPESEPSSSGGGGGTGDYLPLITKSARALEETIAARPLKSWSRGDLRLLEERLRTMALLHEKVLEQLGN